MSVDNHSRRFPASEKRDQLLRELQDVQLQLEVLRKFPQGNWRDLRIHEGESVAQTLSWLLAKEHITLYEWSYYHPTTEAFLNGVQDFLKYNEKM